MADVKKPAAVQVAEADVEFKQSVDQLTNAIVEDLQENYHNDMEPFEAYAQRVRAQIHENMDDFRSRFLQGYEVILNELALQYSSKSDEQEPPPGALRL